MSDEVNKSIASTLNTKIRTSWVWLVLMITVGLTVLFYFSQKPLAVNYSDYVKTLSDYLLQESSVMRSMDQIRVGVNADLTTFQNQSMALREMAVSFSRDMNFLRSEGNLVPSADVVQRFERETFGKIAGMRRYADRREDWFGSYRKCYDILFDQDPVVQRKIRGLLDSARAGYSVSLDGNVDADMLPDSLRESLLQLFQENEELTMAWNSFNNGMTMAYSEDLIRFFKSQSANEMSMQGKIPMAFYFLSLVLLLSTFFFILYGRR